MCGIAGFLTYRSDEVPAVEVLRSLRDVLTHRGPDDSGEFMRALDEGGPFVFLGHRRLSIIDLGGGHQPLSNEDGTVWVTFNGEIYNFMELRPDLEARGHRFRTHSDTEVLVHAYEEYGVDCFRRFNGMFALAIWDDRNKQLVLARDRLGKKPLYYSILGDTLLFGSELKALMAFPRFPRTLDRLSLVKYLFYEFIPAPHTIFKEARKLPPATCLVWQRGVSQPRQYWSPFESNKAEKGLSEAEAEARLTELLRDSVRRRLISDVPLGIFLSGGIDSSAITALAQKEVPGKVKTFSIGFEDRSFDESTYARLVANHLHTDHYERSMTPGDMINLVPRLPEILDEPMADASILPTTLLSRFTREHVTVALGGDGGDELLAGYPTYLAHRFATPYQRLMGLFHPVAKALGGLLPVSDDNISFDFKVKKFLSGIGYAPGVRNYVWLGSFSFPEFGEVLSSELYDHLDRSRLVEEIEAHEAECPSKDELTRLQYLDLRLYLQEAILVKVDRASMANSLEVRAPFLDHEFVEFALGLPPSFKLKRLTSKYILKKTMKDFLPPEIAERPKKGFGVPIAKWVKGPLKELFQDYLSFDRIRKEGVLNPGFVETLLQDHLANKKDNRKQLWTLLVWELWLNRYHPTL